MQAEAGTGARSSGEAQGVAQRGEQRCRMNGLGEQYEVMIFGAGRFDEVRRRRLPEKEQHLASAEQTVDKVEL
jgi:hypothetical protein